MRVRDVREIDGEERSWRGKQSCEGKKRTHIEGMGRKREQNRNPSKGKVKGKISEGSTTKDKTALKRAQGNREGERVLEEER